MRGGVGELGASRRPGGARTPRRRDEAARPSLRSAASRSCLAQGRSRGNDRHGAASRGGNLVGGRRAMEKAIKSGSDVVRRTAPLKVMIGLLYRELEGT